MGRICVAVKKDHLQRLAVTKKAIFAIAELIWNSLDADATHVQVVLKKNKLGGVEEIRVSDDGHGIHVEEAEAAFGNLGGSWKTQSGRSKNRKRLLHGRAGKGRFRAFSLGSQVVWATRFSRNGSVEEYTITGTLDDLSIFETTDPRESTVHETGTEVVISGVLKPFPSLSSQAGIFELTALFAIYLSQYPDVEICYDGMKLEPDVVQTSFESFDLGEIQLSEGRSTHAKLALIEWSMDVERSLFLCDADGFALEKVPAGIHAPGYSFTAYLQSEELRKLLEERNVLILAELDPDLDALLEVARQKLRDHFREKSAQEVAHLVEQWKKEAIYPYAGEPANPLEHVERQVFDVLALSVNEYLPEFEQSRAESKRLQFRLLKQVLEDGPSTVQKIFGEVLDLPQEKQQELADLLERTSLAAIINASKVVADRLDFLRALEILLFQYRDRFKERSQLHKLLETRTWVFGEQFALMVSNRSLTEVLKKHIELLGRNDLCPEPVLREDGTMGFVDLMLSRSMRQSSGDRREHLILELKRPSRKIDTAAYDQVESYAFAVAADERFRDTDSRWVFWAVSNDLSESIRRRARQKGKPVGLVHESDDMPLTIWVKSWGEIIDSCQARLQFFQENLEYSPDDESALAKLKAIHEKLLLPGKARVGTSNSDQ